MAGEQGLVELAGAIAAEAAALALTPLNLGGLGSRLNPSSFVVYLVVGLALYVLASRAAGPKPESILSFLFPRSAYLSRSSLVDLKIYVAGRFLVFSKAGIRLLSTSAVAAFVSAALIGFFGEPAAAPLDGWRLLACFALVVLAHDFGGYWLHRMSHEAPALWPFHKVHHSAEALTPLTVARVHPVYGLVTSFFIPITVGPVLGVIYALFGEQDALAITAVNGVYLVFNLAGSNLRHSHLWLSYGPVLSRILISPAMHQIHHSADPKHYDRNFGEIFALWDWMFGTIYVPVTRETLAFGLGRDAAGAIIQPHPTLRAALVGPFLEAGEVVRAGVTAFVGRLRTTGGAEVSAAEPASAAAPAPAP